MVGQDAGLCGNKPLPGSGIQGEKMNRAERRRRQKENTSRGIKKLIEDDIIQEVENQRVEAMLLCFTLALHEEFGFGKERCLRALQRVDSYMGPWVSSKETVKQLAKKVKDEVGIVISC